MNLKRKPKSKSGRLLWEIRRRLLLDVQVNAINEIPTDPWVTEAIDNLTRRIQYRLQQEDKRKFYQSGMFTQYQVSYIRPRRKKVEHRSVSATSQLAANNLIIQRYGHKTQIIFGNALTSKD